MSAMQRPPSPFIHTIRSPHIPPSRPPTPKPHTKPPTPILLISSLLAGALESLSTYPFEYAKTRVQLQNAPGPHHNPFSVIYHIARSEGFSTVFTGAATQVLGTAAKVCIRFTSFSYFRRRLADEHGAVSPARCVLAASLAGVTESGIVAPTERVKTFLISSAMRRVRYRGELHAYDVIRAHGVESLYKGLLPTVLKQSSTQAVKMGSYNILREFSRRQEVPQNGGTAFLTGALAGAVTVYVTQPLDTIKTVAQSGRGMETVDAVRGIVRCEGLRGLWSGSTSRVGRLACSSSILYAVYESVSTALNGSLEREVFVYTPVSRARC